VHVRRRILRVVLAKIKNELEGVVPDLEVIAITGLESSGPCGLVFAMFGRGHLYQNFCA
jgi:hypothetical protein